MIRRSLVVFLLTSLFTVLFFAPARAGTRVYITISIGGGAFIGMVGFFFHLTYSDRIAKNEQEEREHQAKSEPLTLKSSPYQKTLFFLEQDAVKPIENHPSDRLEVKLFTYKW